MWGTVPRHLSWGGRKKQFHTTFPFTCYEFSVSECGTHLHSQPWGYPFEVLALVNRQLRVAPVLLLSAGKNVVLTQITGQAWFLDSHTTQALQGSRGCVKPPYPSAVGTLGGHRLYFRSFHIQTLKPGGWGHYTCVTDPLTTRRFFIFQVLRDEAFIFLW